MDVKAPTQRMFDELVEKVMLCLHEANCFGEEDMNDERYQEVFDFYENEVRAAIGTVVNSTIDVVAVYTPVDIEHVMDSIFSPAWREDFPPAWRTETLNEIVHSSEMRQAFEQIAGNIIYRKLGIT